MCHQALFRVPREGLGTRLVVRHTVSVKHYIIYAAQLFPYQECNNCNLHMSYYVICYHLYLCSTTALPGSTSALPASTWLYIPLLYLALPLLYLALPLLYLCSTWLYLCSTSALPGSTSALPLLYLALPLLYLALPLLYLCSTWLYLCSTSALPGAAHGGGQGGQAPPRKIFRGGHRPP